ncbi:MAG: threonine ammonia-lyase, biosynthetic, partial [Patescibacteria group bacterium]|nr:threonine ammonia-lyase, biosynthetic [Patescibacteria group bacterium]
QFIAERTAFGSDKEALYAIELAEKPGSLKTLCDKVVGNHNISQFAYRLQNREKATILVGVSVRNSDDKQKFEQKLTSHHYKYLEATNNDLAKQHIRHMIGGKSPIAKNEHFYQISFPERPGALADFLKAVSGLFNISLFHYRGQGSDSGYVLIGFEAKDYKTLEHILTATKYGWHKVDKSEILNIFI